MPLARLVMKMIRKFALGVRGAKCGARLLTVSSPNFKLTNPYISLTNTRTLSYISLTLKIITVRFNDNKV
jgi:hypothetical protein